MWKANEMNIDTRNLNPALTKLGKAIIALQATMTDEQRDLMNQVDWAYWEVVKIATPEFGHCSFCGEQGTIHPDSQQQFGEPVCVPCFNRSFTSDPTNDGNESTKGMVEGD